MATILKFFITIFFVAIIIWLSVINRSVVDFSIAPFFPIDIPVALPIIMLGCVLMGFIWGAFIVWLNGGKARGEARRLRREVKALEKTNEQKTNIV